MTEHGSFYRKITYVVLIAVLLLPISQLGAPATTEGQGGKLAQLREEHDLGQSNLGEIDPASETIRLATLGLRGVAVSMLWNKANDYKKKEDWTNFRATLEQLAKLQPYFIKFWQYQAWNLSYNVSVELDDVQDRFHYVKRGIDFLKKGIRYNRGSAYLLSELGWFIGNKIGKADEKKEYRRLFKADDDFHPEDRPPERRDNWLVSREWYDRAIVAGDEKGIGQKNPTTFYSNPGRSQINYSEAIESEGTFGEKARAAWETASRLWKEYGNRDLRSSQGLKIRLGDLGRLEEESEKLKQQVEALIVDGSAHANAREELLAMKRAALTSEQRAILDAPSESLDQEKAYLLDQTKRLIKISDADVADYIAKKDPRVAAEARRLGKRVVENLQRISLVNSNRGVVNYDYWEVRCQLEQTPEALKARALAYDADRVFRIDADFREARRLYEECFVQWAKALEGFPDSQVDSTTGDDIMEYVRDYSAVLDTFELSLFDQEIGSKFPLWRLVAVNDANNEFRLGVEKFLNREQKKESPSADKSKNEVAEGEEQATQESATE